LDYGNHRSNECDEHRGQQYSNSGSLLIHRFSAAETPDIWSGEEAAILLPR
jgi:hypothetical protein